MVTGGKIGESGLPTTGESPIADYMAAALLAFGVSSALFRRERTGRGGRVDTSLLQSALALQNNLMVRVEGVDGPRHADFRQWLGQARQGGVPFAEQTERMPRNRPVAMAAVYYRTYATKDAALAVACGSPSLRRKFIAAVGHSDPALAGQVADVDAHYAQLKKAVEATVAGRTTEEWQAIMASAGVPASRVALPLEILDDDAARRQRDVLPPRASGARPGDRCSALRCDWTRPASSARRQHRRSAARCARSSSGPASIHARSIA